MARRVVEVRGVCAVLPDDRMADKLTIHFLRPRNGGGDVQRVIFPTSERGQAFVVFELPRVADHVLRLKHVLDIEGQLFPLQVRLVDQDEVDLPVVTKLNLNLFSGESTVRALIRKHGFNVTELGSRQLYLEGTFLKLRELRTQLQQLLETHQRPSTPVASASGAVPKSMSRNSRVNGILTNSSTGSPLYATESADPSDHLHTPRSLSTSNSGSPRSFPSNDSASFLVDSDGFHYAMKFRKPHIDDILECHSVVMKSEGDTEITSVMLSGKASQKAMVKLQSLFSETTSSLRTQEIDLTGYGSDDLAELDKLLQQYQRQYSVLLRRPGEAIVIIGTSKDSFEMKTKLMSQWGLRRGRDGKRDSSSRRSMSLPKSLSKNRAVANVPFQPEHASGPQVSAAWGHSPSRYQDTPRRSKRESQTRGNSGVPTHDAREGTKSAKDQAKVPSGGSHMPNLKQFLTIVTTKKK
ncbi:RNA-binding protein 43 [Denticeps clupeoides]|uniref:RNA-binding protein 43 n=1 Tax=Denticeps clupeoides TaxID=299321 RepID=UPI0010A34D5C|nr:RNA-binding protein 43 [Denticeps clupeoides]